LQDIGLDENIRNLSGEIITLQKVRPKETNGS